MIDKLVISMCSGRAFIEKISMCSGCTFMIDLFNELECLLDEFVWLTILTNYTVLYALYFK